jgi:pilus assembly protein CpaE
MNIRSPLLRENASKKAASLNLQNAFVAVLGSKGGVGSTTLAINLAAALGERINADAVTLVDANLQQPDAALMLACEPIHSVVELFKRAGALEEQIIDACRCHLSSTASVKLVSPPLDGSAASQNNLSELVKILGPIGAVSNGVVLDLPKNLDRYLVSMLDLATVIVLVLEPNLASIAAAKRWLAAFEDLGYPAARILLAANRLGGKFKFVEEKLFSSFNGYEIVNVPNAYSVSESCAIAGAPIVVKFPKDNYSKAMRVVAERVVAKLG